MAQTIAETALNTVAWPLFFLLRWPVKNYLVHAPSWAFGFGGLDELDQCSRITGVSSSNLAKWGGEFCAERLDTFYNGQTVLVLVGLVAVFSRDIAGWVLTKRRGRRPPGSAQQGALTNAQRSAALHFQRAVQQTLNNARMSPATKEQTIRAHVHAIVHPTLIILDGHAATAADDKQQLAAADD